MQAHSPLDSADVQSEGTVDPSDGSTSDDKPGDETG